MQCTTSAECLLKVHKTESTAVASPEASSGQQRAQSAASRAADKAAKLRGSHGVCSRWRWQRPRLSSELVTSTPLVYVEKKLRGVRLDRWDGRVARTPTLVNCQLNTTSVPRTSRKGLSENWRRRPQSARGGRRGGKQLLPSSASSINRVYSTRCSCWTRQRCCHATNLINGMKAGLHADNVARWLLQKYIQKNRWSLQGLGDHPFPQTVLYIICSTRKKKKENFLPNFYWFETT